jgi:predicted nuclease with TOPRIM domain
MAEQIRQKLNRGTRVQLGAKQQEKEKLRQQTRKLRAELSKNQQLLRQMASENARLLVEVEELRALVKSERVVRLGN